MSRLTLQEWIKQMESIVGADELANYMFREEIAKGVIKPVSLEIINERKQRLEWLKELQHYKDLEEQGRLIEQKHERWVYRPDNDGCDYECSNLHCQCRISYNGSKVSGDFNYCPNCGAKMDEVK